METNNSQSAQGEPSSMEAPSTDWRSQLQPDARQRIVNNIMDTLKRHLPVVGPEGMGELKKIALRFEQKIYSTAVNQSNYLLKISMKMLSMETKTQQNTSMNSQPGINQNPTDTVDDLQQQQQQQQQQLLGQQANMSNIQQNQLLGQQNNIVDIKPPLQQQQQRLPAQQNNLVSMQQPQGQQSHLLSSQQQLMPQFQSQSGHLQQQLAMQQQPNSIQREVQQMLQLSGGLLQSQTAMEQQKSFMPSQRGIPEVSSSTMNWWQIQAMKEAHFAELQDFHLKISLKVQQPDLTPHAKQSENYEKLKSFKQMLDRLVDFLQISKSDITPSLNGKLSYFEKQLINMLTSNRRQKVMPSQQQGQQQFQHPVGQQQFQHPLGHSQSAPQHQPSQVMQAQQQDNNGNQAQQMNMSSAVPTSMQHGAMTLFSLAAPAAQQNITNSVQVASDLDPVQLSSFGSLQQGSMGSVQQNGLSSLQKSVSTTLQANLNNLSQNSMNLLQANSMSLQSLNALQQQHLKQQQQEHLMQNQQLQQRQIQQQLLQQQQRQQLLQLQQLPQQQKQQQPSQMSVHQMSQLHPMNELNEMKARQGTGIKPGLYPPSYAGGQRLNHQQHKPGASFPISSPQNLQASSPQISHNSSPQIDQHALLPILTKAGTPVQSTGSPFVVASPSTPIAPSPIPGDSEKFVSAAHSHQTGGHATLQQPSSGPGQVQAISMATPGLSASPLLAEFTSQEGNPPNSSTMLRTSASERRWNA